MNYEKTISKFSSMRKCFISQGLNVMKSQILGFKIDVI